MIIVAYIFYVIFFKMGLMLKSDYLTTQVICPAVNELRTFTAQVDANLFLHFKSSFSTWCDVEDTFFRFLFDLWVRSIVTNTDDLVLVFQTLPKALMYDVLLINAVVPVVSFLYASLLAIVYHLESYLPRPKKLEKGANGEKQVQPFLLRLESLSDAINSWGLQLVGSSWDMTIFPPETKWRKRPDLDRLEGFFYWRSRITRWFSYYFKTCLDALNSVMWYIVISTGVARIVCIWFGLAPRIHSLFNFFGGGSIITDARRYFGSDWDLIVNESTIAFTGMTLFNFAEIFLGSLPGFVVSLWHLWLVLLVVAIIVNGWICTKLLYQRRASLAAWALPPIGRGGVLEGVDFGNAKTLQPRPEAKEPAKTPEKNGTAEAKPKSKPRTGEI
jgi:hypothetical protein